MYSQMLHVLISAKYVYVLDIFIFANMSEVLVQMSNSLDFPQNS